MFLILIAVVLFAALTYAVTSSTRSGGDNVSEEKMELKISEMLQYAAMIKSAVTRVRVSNGCGETEISFADNGNMSKQRNGTVYDYTNPNAPADKSCHIFHPNGGGVPSRLIPDGITVDPASVPAGYMHPQSFFISSSRVSEAGTDSGTDLVLWLGRLTENSCMQVNEMLGVAAAGTVPVLDTFDCDGTPFDGTYQTCSDPIGDDLMYKGNLSFCALTQGGYIFFHVLIAR